MRDVLRAVVLLKPVLGVVGTPSPMLGFMGPVAPLPVFLRVEGYSLIPAAAPRRLISIFSCRSRISASSFPRRIVSAR